MSLRRTLALAAVALLVALAVWLGVHDQSLSDAGAARDRGPGTDAPVAAAPALVESPGRAASRAPAGAAAATGGETGSAHAAPRGRLRLAVLDATTGAPLTAVSIRLLSEKRFSRVSGNSPFDELLRAARYEGLLLRRGFDPLELEPFVVQAGETTDLGAVSMPRGSAVFEGIVRGPATLTRYGLAVELHGVGRNPCPECESAGVRPAQELAAGDAGVEFCPHCGFGVEHSIARIGEGQPFGFHSLAAGDYHVVVRGRDDVILFVEEHRLAAGEQRWCELALDFIDLELRLVGPDGRPFDGDWLEDGERFADAIRFYFWKEGVCFAVASVPPLDPSWPSRVAEGDEDAPPADSEAAERAPADTARPRLPLEALLELPIEHAARGRQAGQAAGLPQRDDADRKPWHSLWPSILSPDPRLATKPLRVTRLSPGLYRVRNVPLTSRATMASCGPFFSEHARLALEEWDGEPVEVHIRDRCGMRTDMLKEMGATTTCTSCHALPDHVLK